MSIGLNNYDFTEKEKWRIWTWNRIREKTNKKPSEAIGLYFAASQDLDRPIAIKKGFANHNLLAVERDSKSVKTLRKKGVNVIHSDLVTVLNDWRGENDIDFINADFTCGITNDILTFLYSLYLNRSVSDGCVVAINLLRGRDNGLSHLAEVCEGKTAANIIYNNIVPKKKQNVKHRGQRMIICGLTWVANNVCAEIDTKNCFSNNKKYRHTMNCVLRFIRKANPSFYSYKSSNGVNVMDSCVFKINKTNTLYMNNKYVCDNIGLKFKVGNSVSKIAAAKAVRTMKLRECNTGNLT